MRSLLVLAAALAACAATGGGPATAAAGDPDAAGQRLYRAHCAACHRLRDPSEQTPQGWARAVEHYGPRAHLSGEERRLVLEYLQARAREDPAPPGRE
jgi:mono/diheme cytochrome c family protein